MSSTDSSGKPEPRPLRADAARNRLRLIDIAADSFSRDGVDTSLEEVAKRAEVGIGTLYRHFPTRGDLIEAVYRREIDVLCDGVDELIDGNTADDALAIWIDRFVAHVRRKKGMSEALHAAMRNQPDLFADTRRRVRETIGRLLTNAADAGAVRADVDPDDVMRLISGVCLATDTSQFAEQGERMVRLIIDGLRFGAVRPAAASR
ncbi:TetR/AcrR family transcriptional regulator [Antrihabitans cavernicola]|uniref:TetR family transcriptional regulator n=1 Tax=Antrihabitans cavernicola TaxID=2495913 RepID=A0A5A7SCM7_9NOCA|nr:TetR family transcriptional regulator [Spelaeibacter cavernicola]KAA0023129.1 TetR family transcriptional regulator [Spelaeibacter cavernicola]